jgi:hypothetical protein
LIRAASPDNARTAWDIFRAEKAIAPDMNITFKQAMPHLSTQEPPIVLQSANRVSAAKNAVTPQVIAMLDTLFDFPNVRSINRSNAVADTLESSTRSGFLASFPCDINLFWLFCSVSCFINWLLSVVICFRLERFCSAAKNTITAFSARSIFVRDVAVDFSRPHAVRSLPDGDNTCFRPEVKATNPVIPRYYVNVTERSE